MRLPSPAGARRVRTHPPIAVTLGDPGGIGPDITLLGWRAREAYALHPFAVYGDANALQERGRTLGLEVPIRVVAHLQEAAGLFAHALPVMVTAVRGGRGAADADAAI
ncbi:MAG: hypothetical protein J2P50_12870, partial [Hyphomicrobiaceae bacterium]|nr:hypothetical protein [Hyphomicrobiaceae bacterium]